MDKDRRINWDKRAPDLDIDETIRTAYYDLSSPAAYSGIDRVLKQVQKINPQIKREHVEKYLQGERTYTLHRPSRRIGSGYQKLKTIPTGLNSHWQCDLADFRKIKKDNKDAAYLLVCIDVLSRKIYATPTKSKAPKDMIQAFDRIWAKAKTKPGKLYSDMGLEFQAREMQKYFEKLGILKYVMYSSHLHAGVVERANRTIKTRLYKYFTQNDTNVWIDVIDQIINNINNSINRTIGIRPNSVTSNNAQELYQKVYKPKREEVKPKFHVGQIVRIDKEKGDFPKGYLPNYTEELFRIAKVKYTDPPHYRITALDGEEILGVFYKENLALTRINPNSRISKVIGERKNKKGEKEYRVHWIGEPNSRDEWMKLDQNHALV